jgi:hypothetical protein
MFARYRVKGKHRGKYKPKAHWNCLRCTSDCNCMLPYGLRTVRLTPYFDVNIKSAGGGGGSYAPFGYTPIYFYDDRVAK